MEARGLAGEGARRPSETLPARGSPPRPGPGQERRPPLLRETLAAAAAARPGDPTPPRRCRAPRPDPGLAGGAPGFRRPRAHWGPRGRRPRPPAPQPRASGSTRPRPPRARTRRPPLRPGPGSSSPTLPARRGGGGSGDGGAGLWTLRSVRGRPLSWRGTEGQGGGGSGMGFALGRKRGPPPPGPQTPPAKPATGGPGGTGPCAPVEESRTERGAGGEGSSTPEAARPPRPLSLLRPLPGLVTGLIPLLIALAPRESLSCPRDRALPRRRRWGPPCAFPHKTAPSTIPNGAAARNASPGKLGAPGRPKTPSRRCSHTAHATWHRMKTLKIFSEKRMGHLLCI